tara:strand:- start:29602 stop:30408 length:807 start_codon:yes stop_codon:yes gene_type:complete
LKKIIAPLISKNIELVNYFKGEDCYIFGNGSSIKFLDLDFFTDKKVIGINHILLHKKSKQLDLACIVLPESYFFYSYYKNPYTKRIQKNLLGSLFKMKLKEFPNIRLFTSVTNFFGNSHKLTNYIHHFGFKSANNKKLSIDKEFSFMAGGLSTAIGVAINLGFKKAILVGCDYLLDPVNNGHFYTLPVEKKENKRPTKPAFIDIAKEFIELELLSPFSSNGIINTVECNQIFKGHKIKYKENYEIVEEKDIKILQKAFEKKDLVNPVK